MIDQARKKRDEKIKAIVPYIYYLLLVLTCMDFCANGHKLFVYAAFPAVLFFICRANKLRIDGNTIILTVLSLAILITSIVYYDRLEVQRAFNFLLAFLIGYQGYFYVEDKKQYVTNVVSALFIGNSILLVATYFHNLTIPRYGRVLYNVWTGNLISVTHIGAISSMVLGFSVYSFFCQKKLWLKMVTAFVLIIVVLQNLDTGTRTPILAIPVVYGFMSLFLLRKIGLKKVLLLAGCLLVIVGLAVLAVAVDLFGIRAQLEKIPFVSRFMIEGFYTPRLEEYAKHLRYTLEYPWGGMRIHRVTRVFAHNYIQDAHDRYGIFAFVSMIIMTIFFMRNLVLLIFEKNKKSFDYLFIALYISLLIQLCLEPIFSGYSLLMLIFLIVHGLTTAYLASRNKLEKAPPADFFTPGNENPKTIVEINVTDYGSTGKIMLDIASCSRENGHIAYTYSKTWREDKDTVGHRYIGSKAENIVHHIIGPTLSKNERCSYFSTKKLIKELEEIQPNVVHLHNLHGWYLHLPALFSYIKKEKIRVVWTLHDCWAFTGHCPHFDMIGCEKWKTGCYQCPQLHSYPYAVVDCSKKGYALKKEWFTGIDDMTIVTPSAWLADLVKQSFLKEYPVQVIANGLDREIFKPTAGDFRKKNELEDKYVLLGVSFNWDERKGLDVFLELAKRLSDDYRIVLVGTDDQMDKMLPSNVISIHRTFNQKELASIYTAADLFVNPTREDTFPTVNIEALACGTPVLTFKTGGSPEIIDETCGSVVAKNDIDALQSEIERICAEKPYSTGACTSRAANFDKNDKFQEYVKLYEKE